MSGEADGVNEWCLEVASGHTGDHARGGDHHLPRHDYHQQ